MIQLKLKREKFQEQNLGLNICIIQLELINKNPAEKLELPKLQKESCIFNSIWIRKGN